MEVRRRKWNALVSGTFTWNLCTLFSSYTNKNTKDGTINRNGTRELVSKETVVLVQRGSRTLGVEKGTGMVKIGWLRRLTNNSFRVTFYHINIMDQNVFTAYFVFYTYAMSTYWTLRYFTSCQIHCNRHFQSTVFRVVDTMFFIFLCWLFFPEDLEATLPVCLSVWSTDCLAKYLSI